MLERVLLKNYALLPAFDTCEILRYAGYRGEVDGATKALLNDCLHECEGVFSYRVCYTALKTDAPLLQGGELVKRRLSGCDRAIVFAATVGLGIDRLIAKYASISAAKALIFQAIGAERIEALCDLFCEELRGEYGYTTIRFSPGYGDFPLEKQREIFELLACPKHIGVSLTESLLMTPTKSVTAVVGLSSACIDEKSESGCAACEKKDCDYKRK